MAYSAQTATIASIANAIKNRIVSETGIDEAYVRLVASDDYDFRIPDEKAVYLRVFGMKPFTDAGQGRAAMPVTRLIRLYIYRRNSSLDAVGHDDIGLTDDDYGIFGFEEEVANCLVEFWPRDADGNELTIEPLHPLDSSSGPPLREAEGDIGFLRESLLYEIRYTLRIDRVIAD